VRLLFKPSSHLISGEGVKFGWAGVKYYKTGLDITMDGFRGGYYRSQESDSKF